MESRPLQLTLTTLVSACLVLALCLYPYIYLTVWSRLQQQGRELFEAARGLGRPPVSAFLSGVLPALRVTLVAGAALVGMETLAEYGGWVFLFWNRLMA